MHSFDSAPLLNDDPASRVGGERMLRSLFFMRRVAILAALLLAVTACAQSTPKTTDAASPDSVSSSSVVSSSSSSSPPSTTSPPVSTIRKIQVPRLVGLRIGKAKITLSNRQLRWVIRYKSTGRVPPGTVISQSRTAGIGVLPGTAIALVIAKAPPPPPPPVTAPPKNCDPSYPDVCLHDGIGDYDCAGGSGNGPNYVDGPIRVLPPDPFGLDRDGDGSGCE